MIRALRRRDPAPSRLVYRLHRLTLSPGVRRAVVWGLPLGLLAAVTVVHVADEGRRSALTDRVDEIRREIEARPEFAIRVLAIDGASDPLAAEIRDRLRLRLPASSFDLDLDGLRRVVAEIDPVASVRLYVRPGGVLQMDVVERVPALIHRDGEVLTLLDAGGHPIRTVAYREDRPDLPLIAGEGAERQVPEALALAEAAAPLDGRLAGFVRMGDRRWDVVLTGDRRILLPEANAVAALDHAIALDGAKELLSRDISALDLRNSARPTLRLSTTAMQTLRDARGGDAE
jgi:cell division protein FtsQ